MCVLVFKPMRANSLSVRLVIALMKRAQTTATVATRDAVSWMRCPVGSLLPYVVQSGVVGLFARVPILAEWIKVIRPSLEFLLWRVGRTKSFRLPPLRERLLAERGAELLSCVCLSHTYLFRSSRCRSHPSPNVAQGGMRRDKVFNYILR